ncbi:hypothetical protein [Parasphingorhabdus pacifica]
MESVDLPLGFAGGLRRAVPFRIEVDAEPGELFAQHVPLGGERGEAVLGAGRAVGGLVGTALGAFLAVPRVLQQSLGSLLCGDGLTPVGNCLAPVGLRLGGPLVRGVGRGVGVNDGPLARSGNGPPLPL